MEKELVDYLATCSTMNYCLKFFDACQFSFELAVANSVKAPPNWERLNGSLHRVSSSPPTQTGLLQFSAKKTADEGSQGKKVKRKTKRSIIATDNNAEQILQQPVSQKENERVNKLWMMMKTGQEIKK